MTTGAEAEKRVLSDYKNRKISLQKAAELLGIHLAKMLELMQRKELYLDYGKEELREDIKGLQSQKKKDKVPAPGLPALSASRRLVFGLNLL